MKYTSTARTFAAAAIAACALGAHAQTYVFKGGSAALNVDLISSTIDTNSAGKRGDTTQSGSLQASWGFELGKHSVLSVGATYGNGRTTAGTVIDGAGNRNQFVILDHYSFYLEPGLTIGIKNLAYLKIVHSEMIGEAAINGVADTGRFTGTGLGLGLRTMLDRHWYMQVEAMQTGYETTTVNGNTYRPSTTVGSVGVGYKF